MDVNLVVLNLGNTRLAIGAFVEGELKFTARLAHAQRGDWEGKIAEAFELVRGKEGVGVAAASVNPPLEEPLAAAVLRATGLKVEWVGRDLDLPVKVETAEPAQTGVDRVLNLAAAYEQMEKACVVVDAGTAITVDLCDDSGKFLGGAIFPGVSMMLDALHQKTAKLPQVEMAHPIAVVGKSTQEAIRVGIFYGIRGMLKEIVENFAVFLGHWPDVIATGGDSALLFEDWELIHAVAPDLPFYGIALAYTDHYAKHDE